MKWVSTPLHILDFDIETRRVGFHNGGKFGPDGCEPTTIACAWVTEKKPKVMVWAQPEFTLPEMLLCFRDLYLEAGMVTGHYIKKFDLPILNGSLLEHSLPLLPPKLVCDTKGDLVAFAGLSKSQENLAGMLEIAEQKYHMADFRWRKSTRLTEEGVGEATKRATEDVIQHMAIRKGLAEAGALRAASRWHP